MISEAGIRQRGTFFLVAAAALVLDQTTKLLADAYLRGHGPVEVVPRVFNLWYSTNAGGLFGYFSQWPAPWRGVLLTLMPLLAIVLIVVILLRSDPRDRITLMGLSLILGGAVGNLIDRVLRGEVVDFLDMYVPPSGLANRLVSWFGTAHWPTFNFADSAIVVGAGFLLVSVVRKPSPDPAHGGD